MAGVKIIEGAPVNTPLAQLSEKERDIYARMRASDAIRALHADCRPLEVLMAEAEQVGWLGEADRDGFIVNVLKKPVRTIDLALEGLQWFDLSRPVPLDDAVNAAAHRIATVEPGPKNGQVGNGRPASSFDNVKPTFETGGGNSADYLAARIKRDRPDIAEAVERGEYRSIRQAAIAAGIVKQNTPLDTLRRAWRKASEEERAQFRDEIDTPIMDRQYA